MTLHADVAGDIANRPPLVLIHGFGGSAAAWNAVRACLPEELPVIVYDLPGHGRSLDAEGRGGAGRMSKALLADLDARGCSSFHLAGHSMGGAVACLIAMRAGARVKSLTLLSPGGMGPEINADALAHFASADDRESLIAALRVMTAEGFSMPGPAVDELLESRRVAGAMEALQETYASMFTEHSSPVRAQGVLPMELLGQLTCPVVVLWGEEDAVLPFHQMDRLPASFEKVHLRGIGHMLLDECPDKVAEMLSGINSKT